MRLFAALVPLITAILLSVVFWLKLWGGGGFIGGDTYTYYMPQKVWYADRLHAGEFPLWNSLAGHGYPLVAESQTGAFYPVNVGLYWMFDVNTAYSISHLLHYVGTFVVAYAFARRLWLGMIGALFAALIFTYGWFPPRACLEWAIIGGFWFVWLLWCAESYLQDGSRRWLLWLSLGLGLHLLAGHFNLAFIALLTLTVYVPARLWYATCDLADSIRATRGRVCGWLIGSIAFGFAIAAVQLWPTWELKQLSQRIEVGAAHDPGYGHLPPLYLSQVFLPWMWYTPDVDTEKALQGLKALSIKSGTNKVEAHLYFGLMPWLVLLAGLTIWRNRPAVMARPESSNGVDAAGIAESHAIRKASGRATQVVWLGLSLIGVFFATGWYLPVLRHVPGFSFFAGPGRYGIITTLGFALIAGAVFDRVAGSLRSVPLRGITIAVVLSMTTWDLWLVSRWVTNAFPLWYPPVNHRNESEVCRILRNSSQPTRTLAPGQNLPTLTGFAMTPQYLGIGPSEYFDPKLKMPIAEDPRDEQQVAVQVDWMRRAGVTHWLRFEPLKGPHWPVRPVWRGVDQLLHLAWARSPEEPLYLYELVGSRGRASFADPQTKGMVKVTDYRANQVRLQVSSLDGGQVILTDLLYPGWEVFVDDQKTSALRIDGMYRGVDVPGGEHTVIWTFQPTSVSRGAVVSGLALFFWVANWIYMTRRPKAE